MTYTREPGSLEWGPRSRSPSRFGPTSPSPTGGPPRSPGGWEGTRVVWLSRPCLLCCSCVCPIVSSARLTPSTVRTLWRSVVTENHERMKQNSGPGSGTGLALCKTGLVAASPKAILVMKRGGCSRSRQESQDEGEMEEGREQGPGERHLHQAGRGPGVAI